MLNDALDKARAEHADGQSLTDAALAEIMAEYEKTLEVPAEKGAKQWLLCTVGIVGSGKSTTMKVLSKELELVRITTDEIRIILRQHGYNFLRTIEIAKIATKKYLDLGYSLALDADAIAPESRNLVNSIAQYLGIPVIWTHVTAPEDVIFDRLKKRTEFGVTEYERRKPLHDTYLSEITFNFTFDTSRPDFDDHIQHFIKKMQEHFG